MVAYARQRGVPMEVIWPQGATRDAYGLVNGPIAIIPQELT